ncbi:HSP20-like chaperone [Sesbania bispinosa]|nr:HSP20-like chaperone [Sesbania bispinosa]
MDPKAQSAANRVYQDFEPFFEWTEDEGSATLVVMLPGFIKDQLRVQVTSTGVLRINGERQVIENIWRRFAKEFSIPSYCDTNEEKVETKGVSETTEVKTPKSQGKPQAKMTQRLKTRLLDFNISLRSADDQNVNQGISGSCNTGLEKRKVLMNVIVAILLVMVIGVYVKNALRWRSSSSYQGEPKFQEL